MVFKESFNFSDLVNSSEFEIFYSAFWELANIPLALINTEKEYSLADEEGNSKLFCPTEKFNPICKILRSTPKGLERCLSNDDTKLKTAAQQHRAICYNCHAGLIDFIVPIYVGHKQIGSIICGQILPEPPTEEGFNNMWNKVKDLNPDKEKLRKVYLESTYMSPEKIESVLRLLSFFADYFCEVGVRIRILERKNKYPDIEKATKYIKKHFHEPISINEVADYVVLSRPYFSKLFKKAMGISFTEYLQELRLEETKRLLLQTDVSISKIAFSCGFSNLSYFNTFFRRMMKCTPGQYRAKTLKTKNIKTK